MIKIHKIFTIMLEADVYIGCRMFPNRQVFQLSKYDPYDIVEDNFHFCVRYDLVIASLRSISHDYECTIHRLAPLIEMLK